MEIAANTKAGRFGGPQVNAVASQRNGGIDTNGRDVHISALSPQAFASDKR